MSKRASGAALSVAPVHSAVNRRERTMRFCCKCSRQVLADFVAKRFWVFEEATLIQHQPAIRPDTVVTANAPGTEATW
jgi:hypothetical protein